MLFTAYYAPSQHSATHVSEISEFYNHNYHLAQSLMCSEFVITMFPTPLERHIIMSIVIFVINFTCCYFAMTPL